MEKTLTSLILGLFGGIGATIAWEGIIKPRRDKRILAYSLSEEIRYNRDASAEDIDGMGENYHIPSETGHSTVFFKSVAMQIGALPEVTLLLIKFYRTVEALSTLPADWEAIVVEGRARGDLADASGSSLRYENAQRHMHKNLQTIEATYVRLSKEIVTQANTILPLIELETAPWYRKIRVKK